MVMMLTETARDSAFDALATGRLAPIGWTIDRIEDDPAALRARCVAGGAGLVLIAGRQIQTREGVEVLALASAGHVDDGLPIRTVLADLQDRQIPAVLPWGVGKWLGKRGALVAELIGADAPGLMLGDNAGRPWIWPRPAIFAKALRDGVPILPGSDPLPLPGAEAGLGAFGCLIDAPLDEARPAHALREHLFTLRRQPRRIGARRGFRAVLAEQIGLRRRKAQPSPAGTVS
ncbi:hypothetical protein Q4543_16145 [Salipiger sp. 1_MG-2023]|nr:hypothetical protein [Salipiger sp. 1_MG-2023]